MYSRQLILLNLLLLCNFCECAKILAVMPTPSYSHQVVFQPLWKNLLLRGHEITLLTTDPLKDSNYTGLKQIDWSFTYRLWHETHNFSSIIINFRQNKLNSFNLFFTMMQDILSQELDHEDVQKLIHDENERFDLAIIEFLHPTMLAFSERFNCPFIGVSSMDIITSGHEAMGNPTNPAIYTDFLVPYDSKMNYLERLLNTLSYLGTWLYFHCYVYPREDVFIKRYFGENIPKLEEVQKKASLVFLNTHPVLHDVRPLMPNVIQIGGAIHLRNLTALPQDLELFLNSSEQGAIYFSLGSNVKVRDLPAETFTILLETLAELPFRIVWKTEKTNFINNVSNIYASAWLPQQEILAHKSVKAFVTQGGQQSLEEAIYYGVPIIGLPFYVDQFANIRRLSRKGACIGLDIENMRKEDFQKAVYEITTNQSYLKAVQELSVLLKEEPISSLEKAVWWTEYVIRHRGAKILRSDVPHMPYYQYYLLDVIATFFFILVVILFIEYKLVRSIIKRIRSKMRGDKLYKLE
ncbi:UDP-glucuronosyltransferase 2B15-like [Anoplophora glabripennis]|uniref:UDP-glucuronosyltransferase 2B15-like n=1 Tax=Anoplophora glabripennis TaxID=217634 RepID=UPI0008742390|nr:UDP-glucuronosyltransferase 2B15-like [Anoplophora glabripennis]